MNKVLIAHINNDIESNLFNNLMDKFRSRTVDFVVVGIEANVYYRFSIDFLT